MQVDPGFLQAGKERQGLPGWISCPANQSSRLGVTGPLEQPLPEVILADAQRLQDFADRAQQEFFVMGNINRARVGGGRQVRGMHARLGVDIDKPHSLAHAQMPAGSLQLPDAPIGLGALTVTLGGDLRAMKDPGGRVRMVRTVNTIRGSYDFQGRRFEILRDGSIRFNGLDDLDPALDIRARRIIQAVEARVNVRGTLKQPEIVLTSVPPLEQADILSLIVFNQPINQLGEGQLRRAGTGES